LLLLAGLIQALAPDTALPGGALDTHAVGRNASVPVAHLALRAVITRAVLRIAPAGCAPVPFRTIDPQARNPLAYTVDAHLAEAGTGPLFTVLWIALPSGAGLAFWAVHREAGQFDARVVDAEEPLGAFPVRAILGIVSDASSIEATLVSRVVRVVSALLLG